MVWMSGIRKWNRSGCWILLIYITECANYCGANEANEAKRHIGITLSVIHLFVRLSIPLAVCYSLLLLAPRGFRRTLFLFFCSVGHVEGVREKWMLISLYIPISHLIRILPSLEIMNFEIPEGLSLLLCIVDITFCQWLTLHLRRVFHYHEMTSCQAQ